LEKCNFKEWASNKIQMQFMLIEDQMNAYVLTGGSSRRFGSDKAISMLDGVTFLDTIYNTLQTSFSHVYSVGKKSYSDQLEFILDFSDYQAAMVGVITALRHTTSPWNLIISVDMPYITLDVIDSLQKEIDGGKHDVIMPTVNGKIFPLSGFYKQNCLAYFEKAYSCGKYRMMNVISSLNSAVVDLSHHDLQLTNVNTQKQIIRLDKINHK